MHALPYPVTLMLRPCPIVHINVTKWDLAALCRNIRTICHQSEWRNTATQAAARKTLLAYTVSNSWGQAILQDLPPSSQRTIPSRLAVLRCATGSASSGTMRTSSLGTHSTTASGQRPHHWCDANVKTPPCISKSLFQKALSAPSVQKASKGPSRFRVNAAFGWLPRENDAELTKEFPNKDLPLADA